MTREVIVTGGRAYDNYNAVKRVLDFLQPTIVIQGGATGTDDLAKRWAIENKVLHLTYAVEKEDWDRFGRAAGPMRNSVMLEENPNATVVAFPGGNGTKDCVTQAIKRNRLVLKYGGQ